MESPQWQTIYPIRGEWHQLTTPIQAAEIYLRISELKKSTNIEATSFFLGDTKIEDLRTWKFYTKDAIVKFYNYLIERIGKGKLLIKIKIQKRHHLSYLLR